MQLSDRKNLKTIQAEWLLKRRGNRLSHRFPSAGGLQRQALHRTDEGGKVHHTKRCGGRERKANSVSSEEQSQGSNPIKRDLGEERDSVEYVPGQKNVADKQSYQEVRNGPAQQLV
jgi:hypothetical protein